jgi:hypothetical protein
MKKKTEPSVADDWLRIARKDWPYREKRESSRS